MQQLPHDKRVALMRRWQLSRILALASALVASAAAMVSQATAETIEVELGCSVTYASHSPPLSGRTLTVLLNLGGDCQDRWPLGEQAIPVRGAGNETVRSISMARTESTRATLTFEFSALARFDVNIGKQGQSVIVSKRAVTLDAIAPAAPERQAADAGAAPELNREEVAAIQEKARQHMLDEEFELAATLYDVLLEAQDHGQHELALEYLGLAQQRLGNHAEAERSYREFLARFPGTPASNRILQRLATILVREPATATPTRKARSSWDSYGGLHQEYFHFFEDPEGGAGGRTTQAALLTFADLFVNYRGSRFDGRGTLNLGYQTDWLPADRSPGDQLLVSNAFLEILDHKLGLSGRLGRQSLYSDGVLGRFDGFHASYRWREDVRFNLTAGSPVDTPRHHGDNGRSFFGASVNLDELLGAWDLHVFSIRQQNDGIVDREALGGELKLRRGRWFLLGQLDYDAGYNVINSAYARSSVRLGDRLQLGARVHHYAYPFLTTENALIGQPFSSIEDMRERYTEPQIRRIARNRTANAINAGFDLSATLSERWRLNSSFSYTKIDGTPAGTGVDARPSSGPQLYYSANFIGSSILREFDTLIAGFRLASTRSSDIGTFLIDARLPFGEAIRIGPRLGVSIRRRGAAEDTEIMLVPALRLTARWGRRYLLELEGGGSWSARDLPEAIQEQALYNANREERLTYFFNLRWGIDL